MSKYYKAEDVIRAIAEQLCWEARTEYGDKFTTEDWLEEAEDYVSDLPTIEVSEDCISREYMLEEAQEWKNMYSDNVFARDALTMLKIEIENAPSVVPTTEQSSMVGEWIKYYEYCEELDRGLWYGYTCSLCGRWEGNAEPYCNCGAKMKR